MKQHDVGKIEFAGGTMTLVVDGKRHRVSIDRVSPRLARATPEQQSHFVVSPSGYGIHWPDIDEDLSIDGLLEIKHRGPAIAFPSHERKATSADHRLIGT